MGKFNIGDPVVWLVPHGKFNNRRFGTVAAIIPANQTPEKIFKELYAGPNGRNLGKYRWKNFDSAIPRDHESYLIAVTTSKKGALTIFYPRVNSLGILTADHVRRYRL